MRLAETTSTIYSLENGILVSTLKADRTMTVLDVAENKEARNSLAVSYPIPFLMDIRHASDVSLEAIIATGNQTDRGNFNGAALLVTETIHELIARESKRFKQTSTPYKIFRDKEKAKEWLAQFVTD
jgi:hypothetical protein